MAITFPNALVAQGSGVTTVTTGNATTTSGSTFLVVASYGMAFAGSANTPTDSKSNTYTLIDTQDGPDGGMRAWYSSNGTGGSSHNATVTFPASDFPVIEFLEMAGAATSSLDASSLASETDAGPYVITSGTLAQADSAVVFWAGSSAAGTQNYAASTFTIASQTDGDNYWSSCIGYKAVSSTSAVTATITGITGTTNEGIVAFKAASSSASAITAASGVATTSTMTGASTAQSTPSAAAGIATTSTLVGSSTDQATISASVGVATTSTMVGTGIVQSTITAAAGQATTSTMTGGATAQATMSSAAGVATTSTLAATAIATASFGLAQGVATTSTLLAVGSSLINPATGQATTSTMTGSSLAQASFVPSSGIASTATMVGSDASAPPGSSGSTFRPTYRPRRR